MQQNQTMKPKYQAMQTVEQKYQSQSKTPKHRKLCKLNIANPKYCKHSKRMANISNIGLEIEFRSDPQSKYFQSAPHTGKHSKRRAFFLSSFKTKIHAIWGRSRDNGGGPPRRGSKVWCAQAEQRIQELSQDIQSLKVQKQESLSSLRDVCDAQKTDFIRMAQQNGKLEAENDRLKKML